MWKFYSQTLPTRTSQVVAITGFFLIVAATLAVLIALAVHDMTSSATVIDDARASHAATAAVRASQAHISATLRDNTVWDDGYRQITSDKAKEFADTTWGKASEDNPLFDAAIVLTPQHDLLSSYKDGVAFDAFGFFGPSLLQIVAASEKTGRLPVVSFIKTPEGLAMVAAGGIQPYTKSTSTTGPFNTLIFAKFLSGEALDQIERTFDLNDLQISRLPRPGMLGIPLVGQDGSILAYLVWPSRNPGAMIYQQAHWYLVAAAIVLAAFLVGVLVTGAVVVKALQQSADRARHKATHDALSGLLNRAGLLAELDQRIAARNAGLMLHLIDLDGFKGVNDAWGHAVGDTLIRLVAERVGELLPPAALPKKTRRLGNALLAGPPQPALLARLGGDEFAVVTGIESDPRLARSITTCLAQPFHIGGRTIEIGASVGTVTARDATADALELLRRADMALYSAKESGRGRSVNYTANLDCDRQVTAALEDQLRQAIVAGEIGVVYQPLVDAKDGKLYGVEALAQWVPRTGRISPEVFIPVAERSGLIDHLGMQVLETAIDQAKRWAGLSLSVNVSPIQLRNPNYAAEVIQVLRTKKFDPHRLTLEITEGVLMTNPDQALRAIEILRASGVKFALDDFGCGYASIGALRTFGFDRMKIDRSLVEAMDKQGGADVLTATIALAHALNIPVTAEGVETRAQADALILSGCDQLQGYLIGRPMPAEAITALCAATAA